MNNLEAKYWYDVAMAATEDTKDAPKAATTGTIQDSDISSQQRKKL